MALVATLSAPYLALIYSPILLGAPHALSDIWLLLVRNSDVPLGIRICLGVCCATILALAGAMLLGLPVQTYQESAAISILLLLPLCFAGPISRAVPQWLLATTLTGLLMTDALPLRAIMAQAHNVVAIGFLLATARPLWGRKGIELAVCSTLIGIAACAIVGFASGLDSRHNWAVFQPLAFGASDGLGAALILAYCFLQLLHFSIWIGFLPSFQPGFDARSILRAFGFGIPLVGLLVLIGTCLSAPAAALGDPAKARSAYLTLVSFHGWMELAWLLARSACNPARRGLGALELNPA